MNAQQPSAPPRRPPGRVLGLIPAKGGSKRLPRKNLRTLGGKPLLQWTIEAALGSGCLDRIVVSTEDGEAAEISRNCGAEVPFLRPDYLAHDPHGVVDVCLHALGELEAAGDRFDQLVVLLPTSPFRGPLDIVRALDLYAQRGAPVLMSVTQLDHSLFAAHVLRDGLMEPLHPEWLHRLGARANREELPILVKSNGAVTVLDVARLRVEKSYYVYPLAAFPMAWPAGLDVDTEEDLMLANALLMAGRVSLEK